MRAATPGFGFSITRTGAIVIALAASLALAACTSNSATVIGDNATPSPTATPPPANQGGGGPRATVTPSPTPSVTPEPTAVQTALDPCELVTAAEASQLAGVTYNAGVESTTSGGLKICTYGGQTKNVFEAYVIQAPDTATAKAGEADALGSLNPDYPGVKVSIAPVTDYPDADAESAQASATVSGIQFAVIGLYMLKGATFVGFSYVEVGGTGPTLDAFKAQGFTTLARVP
jgi:hypothetical protein